MSSRGMPGRLPRLRPQPMFHLINSRFPRIVMVGLVCPTVCETQGFPPGLPPDIHDAFKTWRDNHGDDWQIVLNTLTPQRGRMLLGGKIGRASCRERV